MRILVTFLLCAAALYYGSSILSVPHKRSWAIESLTVVNVDTVHYPPLRDPKCVEMLQSPEFVRDFTSQFGQDAHVFYNFMLSRGPHYQGFYVDVAAAYPKHLSNTYFFDKCLGWKGLCIEGHPGRAEVLRQNRSCIVEQVAITTEDNSIVQFNTPDDVTEITASNGIVGHSKSNRGIIIDVPGMTLQTALRKHGVSHVDYLSLDIEGMELPAVKTIDWSSVTIDVMSVEVNDEVTHPYLVGLGLRFLNTTRNGGIWWADHIYAGRVFPVHAFHPLQCGKPIPEEQREQLRAFLLKRP